MASNSKRQQNNFPADLWIDILCRLPVKFLFRCMCVCKTWAHLIRTPLFVNIHLNYQKASSNTNKYTLYQDRDYCALLTDCEQLFDFTKPSKLYYTPQSFGMPVPNDLRLRLHVHGACDGLICLWHRDSVIRDIHIFLWNPICRKAKKLPKLEIISSIDTCSTGLFCDVLGFGYCEGDYKVVVYAYIENKYNIVSVYSLSTNTWNVIRTSFDVKLVGYVRDTKFVRGTIYTITSENKIICLRLSDETIRVFDFPKEFPPLVAAGTIRVEVYEQTVALLSCDYNYLNMWILRDQSSSTSPWEKKFSTELREAGRLHALVGFLNNGIYLVKSLNFSGNLCVTKLFWCDLDFPKLTEFRSVEVTQHDQQRDPNYLARIYSEYTESLLLLNEDSLDPLVHTEMESFCSSMLLTLNLTEPQKNT